MTALVTENLQLVAGAPNGIAKLRELILVLAVRGKLAPHDPSDEAASELLKRTADARAQRPRRGKAQSRPQAPSASQDCPYLIPSGWQWCRLADLVEVLNGRAYKKDELLDVGTTPVLRVGNLFTSNHWYYSDLELDEDRYCLPGDLLYAWSASFGPFIWSGDRAIYHYHIWKLEPHSDADLNRRYLHAYLTERTQAIKAAGHGVSMTHMTKEKMERIAVPVPPLAEQARIVAKVDELMALCDRLEAEQADAEAAHAKLVEALLASLTQARDAADFRASWQQLAEHFHTLFTTEASVDALERAVLRLAVMGKLVAQVAGGESAAQLLARISNARRVQVESGFLDESLAPYELPDGWCWTTLPAVGELARGKSKHRPRNDPALYAGGTIPLVQTGDVARANGVINTSTGKYNDAGLAQSRLWPAGTMCITIAANIADSAILGFDACFPDSVVGFIPGLPEINVKYFEYFLRTAKADLQKFAPSTAQKNINLDILGKLCVPLPPLSELSRIVAKVDELLTLCEQLRLCLGQAHRHHEHLASVLVEQAVA